MAIEIERKFLVINENWKQHITKSERMVQGYLGGNEHNSVRVRINGNVADLNIKSKVIGTARNEYEYKIPTDDAEELINQLCDKPLIEKTRHYLQIGQHIWEIDVFEGENAGLIVAEIELNNIDEAFEKPKWLGSEVTEDSRYYNIFLVNHPFSSWSDAI